jgi:hypothetical protein
MKKKKQKTREALINQWQKANISYQNYLNYIGRKGERVELTYIDLLYVSNFKGGNASINEDEASVNEKLKEYSKHLRALDQEFGAKYLKDLSNEELESLKNKALSFIKLTLSNSTSIDGFRCSYASALLHFHFPNLIPILDRRVLNGIGIKVEKNKQGQVISIERYYPELITRFYNHLRDNPNKSLREFDKENFIKPIENNETASD